MKPIKADLDNALAQPWNIHTCLLAQTLIRHGHDPVNCGGDWLDHFEDRFEAVRAMNIFDDNHGNPPLKLTPRQKKANLAALRASLPDSEETPCQPALNPNFLAPGQPIPAPVA